MRPYPPRRLLPALSLTLSLLVSACAGTPPVPVMRPTLPRAKPVEAMQPCHKAAQLSVDTDSLPPLVPLALVISILNQVQDAELQTTDALDKCSKDQAAEATWISGDGNDH